MQRRKYVTINSPPCLVIIAFHTLLIHFDYEKMTLIFAAARHKDDAWLQYMQICCVMHHWIAKHKISFECAGEYFRRRKKK